MSEKKLFLEKTHDLEFVVGKIIEAEANRVILNIPRDAAIGRALRNFQVLKREAETAGKEIFIESVDDHILELASIVGMESQNPVFKNTERAVSDILPRSVLKRRVAEVKDSMDKEVIEPPKKSSPFYEAPPLPRRRSFSLPRRLLIVLMIFGALFGAIFLAITVMPRADVHIILKKTPVEFREAIEVSSKIIRASAANGKILIPGELLTGEKNITKTFRTGAKERVEAKAAGTIVIYNAYSSERQTLVATTRFESPDKKIFRIAKAVTVPGAKIENGKIVPSKIEVAVAAEESGDSYNIPPASPWKIPGFRGSPKYEGFYGESTRPMTGGFIGERAAPTSEDLKAAREDLTASLEDALKGEMTIFGSRSFKVFDDAESFKILEEKIDVSSGKNPDSFDLFMKGELRRIVFDEGALQETIASKSREGLPEGLRYRDFKINYGERELDFSAGRIRFEAAGSLSFESDVKVPEVKREIAGKDEESLQSLVFALPGLDRATVSLWPFWVKRVPEDEEKIKVEID